MKTGLVFIVLLFPMEMFSQHLDSIDRRQLDKSLLKDFVRGYHWEDKQGDNNLILYKSVRIEKIEDGMQMRHVGFRAVNFRSLRKDKREAVWEYNDLQEKCYEANDLIARFIMDSFNITDLNNDGTCEIWLMYKISCRTDISPAKLKLIMHEGKKEFIISGHTKVGHTKDTYLGGEQTPDDNFQAGPREFRDYGQRLFERFITEDWR